MTVHRINVGYLADLCRTGDINFRFSGRSSAAEGIAGHQKVQRSRGDNYQKEYPVCVDVSTVSVEGTREATLKGRIDGVFSSHGLLVLDEIKTLRVAVSEIPAGVMDGYWLQAAIYGHMLLQERGEPGVMLRLCLYHLDDAEETILERHIDRAELACCFADALHVYFSMLEADARWLQTRNTTLERLDFPYEDYRAGQRDMAVSVYRTLLNREQLVLQAPTGIGKTMGTLFPAMRVLSSGQHRRAFYLSARTSTQAMAERAARDISAAGARVRVVTLTAKETACLSPGEPCHPDHCVYARGYFDKVREWMPDILDRTDHFDRATIEELARQYELCPFELSLDIARHCDLVISDYNYVFDPVVYLKRFFDTGLRDSVALVDEAHNLVDRARDMFSAVLARQPFTELGRLGASALARTARRVNRAVLDLNRQATPAASAESSQVFLDRPEKLLKALSAFVEAAEPVLREEGGESWRERLLDAYFAANRFIRMAEDYGEDYRTLVLKQRKSIEVKLYCVDPSQRLAACHARLGALVCFSATLSPRGYYGKLLGIDPSAPWYRLSSPFAPENACVVVATDIDTSFRGRGSSVGQLVTLISQLTREKPGNYLVFFPSYDYLEMVADTWQQQWPEIPLLLQARGLSIEERAEFLEAFDKTECLGFAVMGGMF
ncbi:MAG: ATP-dependent DNA helicase, partial [Proteobacteria bacterium]|nr:ATP-dependent DNA helicase [Pseudomonadota bacterium]